MKKNIVNNDPNHDYENRLSKLFQQTRNSNFNLLDDDEIAGLLVSPQKKRYKTPLALIFTINTGVSIMQLATGTLLAAAIGVAAYFGIESAYLNEKQVGFSNKVVNSESNIDNYSYNSNYSYNNNIQNSDQDQIVNTDQSESTEQTNAPNNPNNDQPVSYVYIADDDKSPNDDKLPSNEPKIFNDQLNISGVNVLDIDLKDIEKLGVTLSDDCQLKFAAVKGKEKALTASLGKDGVSILREKAPKEGIIPRFVTDQNGSKIITLLDNSDNIKMIRTYLNVNFSDFKNNLAQSISKLLKSRSDLLEIPAVNDLIKNIDNNEGAVFAQRQEMLAENSTTLGVTRLKVDKKELLDKQAQIALQKWQTENSQNSQQVDYGDLLNRSSKPDSSTTLLNMDGVTYLTYAKDLNTTNPSAVQIRIINCDSMKSGSFGNNHTLGGLSDSLGNSILQPIENLALGAGCSTILLNSDEHPLNCCNSDDLKKSTLVLGGQTIITPDGNVIQLNNSAVSNQDCTNLLKSKLKFSEKPDDGDEDIEENGTEEVEFLSTDEANVIEVKSVPEETTLNNKPINYQRYPDGVDLKPGDTLRLYRSSLYPMSRDGAQADTLLLNNNLDTLIIIKQGTNFADDQDYLSELTNNLLFSSDDHGIDLSGNKSQCYIKRVYRDSSNNNDNDNNNKNDTLRFSCSPDRCTYRIIFKEHSYSEVMDKFGEVMDKIDTVTTIKPYTPSLVHPETEVQFIQKLDDIETGIVDTVLENNISMGVALDSSLIELVSSLQTIANSDTKNLMVNKLIPLRVKLHCSDLDKEYIFWYEPNQELVDLLPQNLSERLAPEVQAMINQTSCHEKPAEAQQPVMDYWRSCSGSIESLSAYPNPASDVINVEFTLTEAKKIAISLHDLSGRKLMDLSGEKSYSSGLCKETFELKNLTSGIYLLVVKADGADQAVQRIIVQ